jgi:hypothetical protein
VKRQAPRPQPQPRPLRLNLSLGPLGGFIAEALARVEAATEAVAAVLLPEPPEPVLGAPSP